MTIKESSNSLSDQGIRKALGERLAQLRIHLEMTQMDLARQAGVGKRTLERLENGESVQLTSLIRIFRVLGLLKSFEKLLPETGPSPMDLLRLSGKERQRASSSKSGSQADSWTWGDER